MYPNWQSNFMTYGGFQTAPPPASFVEPVPKPPLRVKLTPRERGSYNILLSQADPDGHNRVEGAQAVEFFKRSGLSTEILKTVWTICTPEGESYLDRERFYVALRLIALAQEGKPVSEQSIYDDIAAGMPKFQSTMVAKDKWEVEPADKEKYLKLFAQCSSGKGFLTTEEAIEVFKKTQVKPEYLKKIWNLSDPTDTGEFRENQFIVAMHLVTRLKNFSEPVPDELPPALKKVISESQKPVVKNEPFADFGITSNQKQQNFTKPEPFADFGLGTLNTIPSNEFKPVTSTNDFGFVGVSQSTAFSTIPIKVNLEETRSSVPSMNSMLSMNNKMKMPVIEEAKEESMISFESSPIIKKKSEVEITIQKKKSDIESPKNSEKYDAKPIGRQSIDGRSELVRKDEELNENLEKVEENIQLKLKKIRDARAMLSLEREKNQMLSAKLSENKSKQVSELNQLILNILED